MPRGRRPGSPDTRAAFGGDTRLLTEGFLPVLIGPALAQLVADRPEERIPLIADYGAVHP